MNEDLKNNPPIPDDEEKLCQSLRFKNLIDEDFLKLVLLSLKDTRPRVRRYAAIAAGRETWSDDPKILDTIEKCLLQAWHASPFDNEKRHIAESLGKHGGEKSYELLQSVKTNDALLTKALSKAILLFERRLSKSHPTQWQIDRIFPSPLPVRLWCRRGLESLLVRQFDGEDGVELVKVGPEWVDILLYSTPRLLFKNRLFLKFGFPLFTKNSNSLKDPTTIAEMLFQKNARQILACFSSPPHRIRLEHTKGGHQRSLQWKTAEEIAKLSKASGFSVINDSRQADWEALISSSEHTIFLCPKSLPDPRFFYRITDVPAASHPTIAAAMAYIADVKSTDVIWDPFVGSGTELIECFFKTPPKQVVGTDLEEKAILNARTNFHAAGVHSSVELKKADALTFKVQPTLVVTNPPMGRRVPVKDILGLLSSLIDHIARNLASNGRLVWMSPFPELLDKELSKRGFTKAFASKVDMGGFSAELQKWENLQKFR